MTSADTGTGEADKPNKPNLMDCFREGWNSADDPMPPANVGYRVLTLAANAAGATAVSLLWGLLVGGVSLPLLPSGAMGLVLAGSQVGVLSGLGLRPGRLGTDEPRPSRKLFVLVLVTVLAGAAVVTDAGPNAIVPGAVLLAASKVAKSGAWFVPAAGAALAALIGFSFLADPQFLVTSGSTITAGHVLRDAVRFSLVMMLVGLMRMDDHAREKEKARADAAEARAARAAEDERARIARDLHDVVAHHVSVMTLQAEAARTALPPGSRPADRALRRVAESGRSAMAELRRMLGILRASGESDGGLAPQPGIPQIADLVDDLRARGMRITLNVEGDTAPVPAGVALSAYRVVQEALTNVRKHAGSSSVFVDVSCTPEAVELRVVDDGRMRLAGNGRGHGLVGMQERVALVGGTLAAGPRDSGAGWQVEAKLPTGAA